AGRAGAGRAGGRRGGPVPPRRHAGPDRRAGAGASRLRNGGGAVPPRRLGRHAGQGALRAGRGGAGGGRPGRRPRVAGAGPRGVPRGLVQRERAAGADQRRAGGGQRTVGPRSAAGATVEPMTKKWASLALCCLATLLLSVDLTVLHLALPHLVADLGASSTQLLWIGDVYGFALAGLLITMGNVGDRIGRKRLLLIGSAAFAAASAVTAYAPNPELLIAARALLGVAGATIMPSTLSIIRNVFTEPAERTTAIGVWSGMSAAGFALGPVVGGLLLDHFWWGSVFLINLPIMVVIIAAGVRVLPESRDPRPGRIDLLSVALSFSGIVAVIYAVKEAADKGLAQLDVQVAGVLGLAGLLVFVVRQTRLAEPLIDVRLFRRRAFSASIGTNLLAIFTMMAMSMFFAWYFQLVLGWSPLVAGLAGLPGGLSGAIGGVLAAPLVNRIGRNGVVALGLLLNAVSFFY